MTKTTVYAAAITALQQSGVEVIGPDNEQYSDLIKRWSDAAEQKAVSNTT
jgi:hypothetical protein